MTAHVTLEQLREAQASQDPMLVDLIVRLMTQSDENQPPPREGAYTFEQFLRDQQQISFRRLSLEEKAQFRIEKLAVLEAEDAEIPLPDRLRCHEIILDLWNTNDIFSRRCLLEIIAIIPLAYGPFKALKRIFKEAETKDDTEIFGALAARFDMAFALKSHQVSQRTLGYLVRRGWRYLRRIGETFPAIYADVATDFLVHYESYHDYMRSWILNHIFFHEMRAHTRTSFKLARYGYGSIKSRSNSWKKYRAFDELWRRSPRPLFTLLEKAKSRYVISYATACLKSDFRAALREVEPAWVARLISAHTEATDEFVVWILSNVPQFEQSKFRELGLHDAVLQLFNSPSNAARRYAAKYARTHARDLPVSQLIQLANSYVNEVCKLATDLLRSRDPRKEIGLEAWGELLATEQGYEIAEDALRKNFGANELTPEWFARTLLSEESQCQTFVIDRLTKVHSLEQLGTTYFTDIIDQLGSEFWQYHDQANFCCNQLEKIGIEEIPQNVLQRLLLHPIVQRRVRRWINEGKLKASAFGADFLKTIAFKPSYEHAPLIAEFKATKWGKDSLDFSEGTALATLEWLKDYRQFSPADLGFEWLLQLVQRSEPMYHDFAVDTISRIFLPADFSEQTAEPEADKSDSETEISVDLGGASFVFTGKLDTMTRSEAQKKVIAAGGAKASSVNKKLDYLVIGDDGSPLYGQGRKGSKQTKAEKLNEEDDAGIRIISETAFLQMLAGEQREFSADAVQAGCERLWSMMCDTENPDEPLARFARSYIRTHHPEICLAETDRPVDPGAEIPDEFLSFDRLLPLFSDKRRPLRELALEFAHWEFARWSPPIEGIVEMCESPYPEVREFVAKAMTVEDAPEHRRYRLDPTVLTADAVYSFCESRNSETRSLGMKLIEMNPRLKLPEELFRLTESPDGAVRGFVIRTFWSLYRDRGISKDWKPTPPVKTTTKRSKKKQPPIEELIGSGTPERPENLPAEFEQLQSLLRRILFEVPPGRPPKQAGTPNTEVAKMKPMPARQAKLKLVDTLRDLAIEDVEFARYVLPLLQEFKKSRGKSEQAACLVAVTRIEHQHKELREEITA